MKAFLKWTHNLPHLPQTSQARSPIFAANRSGHHSRVSLATASESCSKACADSGRCKKERKKTQLHKRAVPASTQLYKRCVDAS